MRTPARPTSGSCASQAARSSSPRSPRARVAPCLPPSPRASTICGHVVDAESLLPLPGASVVLSDGPDPLSRLVPTPCRRWETDTTGAFEMPRPGAEGAVVFVHRSGHLPEMVGLDSRSGGIVVRLVRAGAVRGELRTEAGRGGFAGVRVLALSRSAMDLGEATADDEGQFAIEGLRPGRYLIHAEGCPKARLVAPMLVQVNPGQTAEVSLVDRGSGASVSVHALDARGRPCAAEALLASGDAAPARTVAELLERGPLLAAQGHGRPQVIPFVPTGRHTLFLVRETGADEPDIRCRTVDVPPEGLAVEVVLPDLGPESEL